MASIEISHWTYTLFHIMLLCILGKTIFINKDFFDFIKTLRFVYIPSANR